MSPLLELKNIHKSYGHIKALQGVDLSILPGQVLALVGDNGSGKTTMVKIISGVIAPDEGEIIIDSKKYRKLTPALAIKQGISTVYQDLSLVDCRDVAENIFLGREIMKYKVFVNKKKMMAESALLLKDLKINIPWLRTPVGLLSGGQRQGVAVARAVQQGGRLLIFDEPTAAMGVQESAKTLKLIKHLGDEGYAVMVISHNLQHVFTIADRICVLSKGQLKGDFHTNVINEEEIVKIICRS